MHVARTLGRAALVALLALGAGCTVRAHGGARVYSEPVGYEVYDAPHTYYDGRTVYWYRDRWMYRDGDDWVVLEREPPELRRHRMYVQEAPPAYRYRRGYGGGPRYVPPPAPAPAP